ncbi:sensor histidine kinase [Massilia sp. TSP1-1-2]|uniref:sensor histidine kinase n=1 Tax=unclassified Massilia TaxID=2609279 RepID=UPI003CF14C23
MELILQEWENFALTLNPMRASSKLQLRDHAQQMLLVICTDLDTYQGERDSIDKSQGKAPAVSEDTAAEIHASERMNSGFAIEELVAEYRAVRASVLRLWQHRSAAADDHEVEDMLRFNEAIDQSLTESVGRYSRMLRESQSVFLAILGHDVRNPLGAISMGAQILLQDEALTERQQIVAKSIFASTNRVNELVGDLLDFSTSHLGDGIPIKPAPYALGEQCMLVVDEMRAFHPERRIDLVQDGDLDVVWDRSRINQALSNLLGNAVEHGADGEPVSVSVHGGAQIVISVRNMGPVMDVASMRTVFEPAQRFAMRPISERNHAGNDNLGLGLYITREIVAAHGGRISLGSSLLAGTCFTLTLPRMPPNHFLQEKDSQAIPAITSP